MVIDSILNYNIQLLGEDVSVTVVGNCSEEIGIHQVDVKMNILEDGEETEYVEMILIPYWFKIWSYHININYIELQMGKLKKLQHI